MSMKNIEDNPYGLSITYFEQPAHLSDTELVWYESYKHGECGWTYDQRRYAIKVYTNAPISEEAKEWLLLIAQALRRSECGKS